MHYFAVFIILLSVVCSHGYGIAEKDRYIRIDLFRQKSPRSQLVKYGHKLEKYGFNFDWANINQRGPPRDNDSINLFRYMDNEFYGKIVIGKPGKTMNVAFDTAWSLSWVLSAKCKIFVTPGCKGHNLYDHLHSSYWKKNGTAYSAKEGNDTFSGFYSYENISIAHSNVTDYLFVEMVNVPDSMAINKADGVLGLGIKTGDYEPFLYTLYRQKKIKDLLFSIYLNRDHQSNRGGNIMLGFVDKKHIHRQQLRNKTIVYDPIKYIPIDAGAYWQFSMDKINVVVDPNHVTTFCQNGCKAIADTSSNEIIGPENDVKAIYDLINATPFEDKWTVDCTKINKLPKIDIVLGGTAFRLSGRNYILQVINETLPYVLCVPAFVPSTSLPTDNLWVLGGAFLSQYYSIYDIAKKNIGFVRAA